MAGVTNPLAEVAAGHRPAAGTGGQRVVSEDDIGTDLGGRDAVGAVGDLSRTALDHLDVACVTVRIVTIPAEVAAVITGVGMCLHLVPLVDLDHRAAVDTGEACLASVVARRGIAVMADQTSIIPAVAKGVVALQAERIGVIDFMTGGHVMTP